VLTNTCGANQTQQFFRVRNNGSTSLKLSDVKLKFWVYDTSGKNVIPGVSYGGCLVNTSGCFHQVSNVTAAASSFSPTCGPDTNHQANWEITISTRDTTLLAPGQTWDNLQSRLNLADYSNFNPGTSRWYSPCLVGTSYATDQHFAIYHKGNLVFSSGINAPDCRAPHGTQQLSGYLTPDITTAPLVGRVPSTTPIHLSVRLPFRTPAPSDGYPDIATLAKQVSDPNSPSYRHYLTPAEFTTHYGPPAADYDKLNGWATSSNLTVEKTWLNRLVLNVTGTAAQVEQAFYVNLDYRLRPDGMQFYALDREPSLDLVTTVAKVGNLDNFFVPKPAAPAQFNATANDLRRAYAPDGCPTDTAPDGLTGAGECVAIYAPTALSPADVDQYRQSIGLPPLGAAQLTYVDLPGNTSASNTSGVLETTLDAEMVTSLAPGADVVLYYTDGISADTQAQGFVSDDDHVHCNQISVSWYTFPGTGDYVQYVYPVLGQTVFLASGDYGVRRSMGASPHNFVTMVGGTVLQMSVDHSTWTGEAAWWQSTGGVLLGRPPIPDYQQGIVTAANASWVSTEWRNIPDVAAVALDITMLRNGEQRPGWGTSAAAPLWAAFMALANQQSALSGLPPVGFANPALYAIGKSKTAPNSVDVYTESFHDVTEGDSHDYGGADCPNNLCAESEGAPGFPATEGYDLVTGWGSPKCGLIRHLAAYSPVPDRDISVGESHSCGIRGDGSISCWGLNDAGQLGGGTSGGYSSSPAPVAAPSDWTTSQLQALQIASGLLHTCAVMSDGNVWCWGDNSHGQLGDGTTVGSSNPVKVQGLEAPANLQLSLLKYNFLTAGAYHSCVVVGSDRHVQCWGENDHGQLGNGTTVDSSSPVTVQVAAGPLNGAASLRAGFKHGCVLVVPQGASQSAMCWGLNDSGQLGVGTTSDSPQAMPVTFDDPTFEPEHLAPGYAHTCATGQSTDGRLFCWGSNQYGQFGNGTASSEPYLQPAEVGHWQGYPTGAIHAGANDTCAILPWNPIGQESGLYCAGQNTSGQLGKGWVTEYEATPQPVSWTAGWLAAVTKVRASLGAHVCALTKYGNTVCWGSNTHGQLGDGTTSDRYVPTTVKFH
jgi:alpha-tubulin suppressor-like RCC1 family protein